MTKKITRFTRYAMMAALLIAALGFEPQKAMAQGGPPSGGGAGSNLQNRVEVLEQGLELEIVRRIDADNQEAADRATADNALQTSLDQETSARVAADAAVQSNLDQEIADRVAHVDAEESARESADDTLTADLAALTDVLCQAIQRMAGNPSAEAIALCGDRLFKTVFLTSTVHDGDLKTAGGGATGLEGGDNICNARAEVAGLPGTYTAWLSSSVTDARDRVTQASVPYRRTVDGVIVADNFADLLDCSDTCLDAPIIFGESGTSLTFLTWTGTNQTGTKDYVNQCVDWTTPGDGANAGAFYGDTRDTGPRWTGTGWWPCNQGLALYCFQD
jgi:hypothetical protein